MSFDGWATFALGEVTDNFDAVRVPVKSTERRPGPYPYYGASGIVDRVDSYLFDGEYLLIAEDGENLRTRNTPIAFLANGKFWVNNHAHIVRGNQLANTRYLAYVLQNTDIGGYISGSTMPKLTQGSMNRIRIFLPPRPTQDAIARIGKSLDDKIELNRRMNETLEAMARALFKNWFIDFGPVRAKADGRNPEGMDEATAKLFPDSFEESELGPIPRGWRVKSLPEAYEVNPSRQLAKESDAPYLDMQSMPTTGHRPSSWIQRPFGSGMKFTNGDTLVARITPCLENGKTAYVDFLGDNEVGWGSTEYIVLRPKSPLPPEHGYYLARTEEFRSFAIQNMTGTSGRQRVPSTCFASYPLVIPDGKVAQRFGLFAGTQMKAISRNSEEASTLAQLRDSLLPKLLSGELRINDAEDFIEAVQ